MEYKKSGKITWGPYLILPLVHMFVSWCGFIEEYQLPLLPPLPFMLPTPYPSKDNPPFNNPFLLSRWKLLLWPLKNPLPIQMFCSLIFNILTPWLHLTLKILGCHLHQSWHQRGHFQCPLPPPILKHSVGPLLTPPYVSWNPMFGPCQRPPGELPAKMLITHH